MQFASSIANNALAWTVPSVLANLETLCKFRQIDGGSFRTVGLGVRLGGDASNKQGYVLTVRSGDLIFTEFSGTSTTSPSTPHAPYPATAILTARAVGTWYWSRMKIAAGAMYGKVWADGSAEPADWLIAVDDVTFADAGEVGFYRGSTFNNHQLDYFAVNDGSFALPLPT